MNNSQKKFLILILLVFGCIITSFITDLVSESKEKQIDVPTLGEVVKASDKITTIRVYVSGAVVKPGLYDVPKDSRADDAVKIAGGFTELADIDKVNLARRLKDGTQVNVPTRKVGQKTKANPLFTPKKTATQKDSNIQISNININTASASELQQLPGIGPSMAQRILAAREEAKFVSVDDMLRVKGIGRSKLERIRAYVRAE